MAALIGSHKRKIRELEALSDVEVRVMDKETTDTMLLPNGKRMTSELLPKQGELMWSPAKDVVEDTTKLEEQYSEEVVRVPMMPTVEGVFVRQWGASWHCSERRGGVGCDWGNHRVQVFGVDEKYLRQWGS